jgi:hypothetical protein
MKPRSAGQLYVMRKTLSLLLLVVIVSGPAWSADLATQVIRGRFPLNLTIPAEFEDMTRVVYGDAKLNPGTATFCTPEDAQLLHDQLRGERIEEQMKRGCITIFQNPSESYDIKAKRFSEEGNIEIMRKRGASSVSAFSAQKVGVVSFVRTDIRGVPIMSYVLATTSSSNRLLHVAEGNRVWMLTFGGGVQKESEVAVWEALINGL